MPKSEKPRRSVVVTGIGVVSPNGIGADAFARACIAGHSGLVRPPDFGEPAIATSAVGAAVDFDPTTVLPASETRRLPRVVPLALAASREALAMAGLDLADNLDLQRRVGCVLGTGGGGLSFVEDQYRSFFRDGRGSVYSITGGTHGNLSGELSIALHLRGPSHVITTGCASSTDAIAYAMLLIRAGIVSAVVVGGADAPISHGALYAFEKMKVVSTRMWDHPAQSSRPFSADRDGFVLGEGAWMMVLEAADHAEARHAEPIAEILGSGSTCDAYHRVQIAPDLAECVRAIGIACDDANV